MYKRQYGGCAFDNNLYCFGRQWDKQGVSVPMMFVSALGQPTVFTPDGTDAGAFYFPVVTDSDFTAICAYKGSVYFFTGHEMYQIYGTVPSNYTAQKIHNVGCIGPDGLCELDGVLYFTDGTSPVSYTHLLGLHKAVFHRLLCSGRGRDDYPLP